MAAANISDLFNNPAKWTNHAPEHANILALVGNGAATNRADTSRHITNLATRSPVVLAFVLAGDEDRIYVGHSPLCSPPILSRTPPSTITS